MMSQHYWQGLAVEMRETYEKYKLKQKVRLYLKCFSYRSSNVSYVNVGSLVLLASTGISGTNHILIATVLLHNVLLVFSHTQNTKIFVSYYALPPCTK